MTNKMSAKDQKAKFIEAAREAGCSEDEPDFDRAIKAIAKPGGKSVAKKVSAKAKK